MPKIDESNYALGRHRLEIGAEDESVGYVQDLWR